MRKSDPIQGIIFYQEVAQQKKPSASRRISRRLATSKARHMLSIHRGDKHNIITGKELVTMVFPSPDTLKARAKTMGEKISAFRSNQSNQK